MSDKPNIREKGKVTDESGHHRLVLNFVEVLPPSERSKFYDFSSLVWESMEDNWTERVAIGSAAFQQGCERRRWVNRLHSFDPSTGRALIQVGECWPGVAPTVEYAVYSWREWDLTHNQEVRLIRVCGSPFEAFDGNAK